MTQRIDGHYSGDVQHYRPPGELDAALAAEPIARAERVARAAGVGDADLAALRQRVVEEIDRAAEAALAAPLADPATVEEHVYA
jgi:pyruvate dehydrogenase E1 component alpha subunit